MCYMTRTSYCSLVCKLQLLLAILSLCCVPCFVCARSGNYVDKSSLSKDNYGILVGVDARPSNFDDPFPSSNSLLSTFIYNSPARAPRAFIADDAAQGNGSESNNSQNDNCTDPHDKGSYENTCQFVIAECGKKSELINYLAFVLCDLPDLEVRIVFKHTVRLCRHYPLLIVH